MAKRTVPKQKEAPGREISVLHRRIKERREELELSQEQLAYLCGVDKTSVSHWELGIASPRLDRMGIVAKALRVPIDELVDLYVEAKAS